MCHFPNFYSNHKNFQGKLFTFGITKRRDREGIYTWHKWYIIEVVTIPTKQKGYCELRMYQISEN